MASIAILGGGISGLAAGYFLNKQGLSFSIFEASEIAGGKIKTERSDGFLVEHGPNSLQTTFPLLNDIIDDLGLATHQIFADEKAKKRFVVRQGRPRALPMSPPAFISSGFFSITTKLNLLKEPFLAKHKGSAEESVAAFVRRRMGREILDYAVDPFVTGIFAGDPESLSLEHAFPALAAMEADHGSVLRGLIAGKKKSNRTTHPKRRIFSFTEGMQMLPCALATLLSNKISLNTRVKSVVFKEEKWQIGIEKDGQLESFQFDAVVNTLPLPAFQLCELPQQINLDLLWKTQYPPVSVVALGFKRENVDHPLDGFGMLIPNKEPAFRILGTLFTSSVFTNRAPKDHVLLTSLVGGARKGDFCNLPEALLQDIVLNDLHELLGVHADPCFVRHTSWPNAIPQYNVGYGKVKNLMDEVENSGKGFYFAGNYRAGISVGDAIKSGHAAAEKAIQQFS